MLAKNDTVVVGISGGPDSVALLCALEEIGRIKRLNLKMHLVHINHMIRARQADEDERFVRELAGSRGLGLSVYRRDIRGIAKRKKKSIEETAREESYRIFGNAARRLNAGKIALGHTADDSAETFLFNMLRGAGFRGLSGIPPTRELEGKRPAIIIRPLVCCTREEVLAYLKEKGARYRIDSTNLETDYVRNKIRLELIPYLEKTFNPKLRRNIGRLAKHFAELDRRMILEARRLWKACATREGKAEIRFSARNLARRDDSVLAYLIRRACEHLAGEPCAAGFTHMQEITRLIRSRDAGEVRSLPKKLQVEKTAEEIIFRRARRRSRGLPPKALSVPGKASYKPGGPVVEAGRAKRPKGLKRERRSPKEVIDFDKARVLGARFSVRSWRKGDVFHPLGMKGEKKLQDFFTDEKIPRSERGRIPLVLAGGEIIWVGGRRISEKVKVDRNTRRFLRLSVSP